VSGAAFEPARDLKYLFNLRIGVHLAPELRYLFKCLIKTHVATPNGRRDELRNLLDLGIWHFECAADVLDGSFRGERSERDDLADRVATIEVGDVVDDVAATTDAEVNIDVGHRHATGIEEALEQQV